MVSAGLFQELTCLYSVVFSRTGRFVLELCGRMSASGLPPLPHLPTSVGVCLGVRGFLHCLIFCFGAVVLQFSSCSFVSFDADVDVTCGGGGDGAAAAIVVDVHGR